MVHLATGTKIKVIEIAKACPSNMNCYLTKEDLDVLPLGSYDVLIGMDWLEAHKVVLDCFNKKFTCTNEIGKVTIVVGISRIV